MSGTISQNGDFYSNDASSTKKTWFQIFVKSVKPFGYKKRVCILQLLIPYCVSLIVVIITSHIFVNIFQTEHFIAVNFTRGNEKNMNFLLIPKSLKEKNLTQSDRALLTHSCSRSAISFQVTFIFVT